MPKISNQTFTYTQLWRALSTFAAISFPSSYSSGRRVDCRSSACLLVPVHFFCLFCSCRKMLVILTTLSWHSLWEVGSASHRCTQSWLCTQRWVDIWWERSSVADIKLKFFDFFSFYDPGNVSNRGEKFCPWHKFNCSSFWIIFRTLYWWVVVVSGAHAHERC